MSILPRLRPMLPALLGLAMLLGGCAPVAPYTGIAAAAVSPWAGVDQTVMPDMVGRTYAEVRVVLEEIYGLDVTTRTSSGRRLYSPDGEFVTAQDPAGGATVARGDAVALTAAETDGNALGAMPPLACLPVTVAMDLLDAAGVDRPQLLDADAGTERSGSSGRIVVATTPATGEPATGRQTALDVIDGRRPRPECPVPGTLAAPPAPVAALALLERASPTEPPPLPTPSPSPAAAAPSEAPTPRASSTPSTPRAASPRGDSAPVVASGVITHVVDGDTIDLADGTRIRIAIVDTPEVFGGNETCGSESSAFTAEFVDGELVDVYRPSTGPADDSSGRLLGEVVRRRDGASLNVALVAAGLGSIDERFVDEDRDLTTRLRAASAGAPTPTCVERGGEPTPTPVAPLVDTGGEGGVRISSVRQDGPGNDVEVYGDSEYVTLTNDGSVDVDLSGWSIIDKADNRVTIPSGFLVLTGGSFRVYSGAGDSVADSQYFAGRRQAYLNNSGGDDLRLVDASGQVVATYSY